MTRPEAVGRGPSAIARGGTCTVCNDPLDANDVIACAEGEMGFFCHPMCWINRPKGWTAADAMAARSASKKPFDGERSATSAEVEQEGE